jgi:hypothetical protein
MITESSDFLEFIISLSYSNSINSCSSYCSGMFAAAYRKTLFVLISYTLLYAHVIRLCL